MAREGDSKRKSLEAYQQHNGRFVGWVKFLANRMNPLKMRGGS